MKNTINPLKEKLFLVMSAGLLTGLVEGIVLLTLYQHEWLYWRLRNRAIWYETLWIAPLVDLILFSIVGVGLWLVDRVLPKKIKKQVTWFVVVLMVAFDWIFIIAYGRISLLALIVLTLGVSIQLSYYAIRFDAKLTRFMRVSLPWLAGLTFMIFLVLQGGGILNEKIKTAALPKKSSDAPNVIVIVVDALRADHLSSYGYARNTSPYIDSLASEGVRFEDAISASSWTQPSHASLLTGHYTYDHQAELKPLDNRLPTIGEVLQTKGYRTGAFSGNTLFFTRRQGFGRGFLHFEDNYQSVQDIFINTLYGYVFDHFVLRSGLKYEGVPGRKHAANINHSVLNWVDQDSEHPFFVFMNYFDVHDPYMPPAPYRNQYTTVPEPGGLINTYLDRYYPTLTPSQVQSEMDAYDGGINYVDAQIKDLFSELQKRGLLDNTLVIITADHGESFGEHGLLRHSGSLYIEQIHVPLIFWWPGHVPAGETVSVPITNSAIATTILSLIGDPGNVFPGPSLSTLILDPKSEAKWPYPISELANTTGSAEIEPSFHGALKSVVTSDYQYIVHEKFGDELYNQPNDPKETNNLAGDSAKVSILDSLKSYLKGLVGEPIFKNP